MPAQTETQEAHRPGGTGRDSTVPVISKQETIIQDQLGPTRISGVLGSPFCLKTSDCIPLTRRFFGLDIFYLFRSEMWYRFGPRTLGALVCYALLLSLFKPAFPMALGTWGILTLVFFVATNYWFIWARKEHPEWKLEAAMVFGIFWGIAAGISILLSMFFAFDSERQQVHAFLCALVGAAAGWCVGMYLTPQDATERGQFARVGAAAAVLLSGYGIKSL